MKKQSFLLLIFFGLVILFSCQKKTDYLHESKADFDKRMEWWRDAGFGMFIHWGLYSIPAGEYNDETNHAEWIQETADIPVEEYEKFALQFNPVKFNADEWVKLAKEAGMKYLVITSKHHDGFCLWDSKVSDYDVVDRTPFKRDILKELAEACRKYDVRFCTYHSIMDWHHPDAQGVNFPDYNYGKGPNPNFHRYVENYLKPQLKELIENYHPAVMWFDGEWIAEWTEEQGRDLYNYVRSLQPDIIINNRVGKARQGMKGMNAYENAAGDFGTPEQEILDKMPDMDWESCMTMNDHWGYNKFDHNFKSTETIIHNLIDIAAKGGNYLLNVGPKPDGTFPEESVLILKKIGKWMKVNGEVIHNSGTFLPYKEGESNYLVNDKKGQFVYLIATRWPGDRIATHYVQPEKDSQIFLLGYDQPLSWTFDLTNGLQIELPASLQKSENRPCDYAWVFKIKGEKAPFVEQPVISTRNKEAVQEALFSQPLIVKLSCATPEAEIHYTLDGSEPDEQSPLYKSPITVEKSNTLKCRAFKTGMIPSYAASAHFHKISSVKEVRLATPASQKHPAQGALTLFDGQLGETDYQNGRWLGFEGKDMVVTIDLGHEKELRSISAGFLQNIDVWIFLPQSVRFEVSTDGQQFKEVGSISAPIPQTKKGALRYEFEQKLKKEKARFVRVKAKNIGVCPDWHKGAGGKAWIFADEIMIE